MSTDRSATSVSARSSRSNRPVIAIVVMLAMTGLAGCAAPTTESSAPPPPSSAAPTAGPIPTVGAVPPGWEAVPGAVQRIDRSASKIFLTATPTDCVLPTKVSVIPSTTEIKITAIGRSPAKTGPCTLQKITLVGYIYLPPGADDRKIVYDN